MTLMPAGAHLAPVDLPPPPPHQDPREPPAPSTIRRGTRTPQRPRSPAASQPTSRGASPQRHSSIDRSPSSGGGFSTGPVPPLPLHAPQPVRPSASPTSKLTGRSGDVSPPGSATSGGASPPYLSSFAGASAAAVAGHHLSRPSSPSSIHSSTSAIFERDIEHPPIGNLALNPAPTIPGQTLTHKPSRLGFAHGSALDHTVPSVLDDAVEALSLSGMGTSRGLEGLEIESPAPTLAGMGMGTAMARQSSASLAGVGSRKVSMQGMHAQQSAPSVPVAATAAAGLPSGHSRSPSPTSIASGKSSVATPAQSPPILGQLSTQQALSSGGSGLGTGNISPIEGKAPGLSATNAAETLDGARRPGGVSALQRPAALSRMSTGKQVPGGWLSAWNQADEGREASSTRDADKDTSKEVISLDGDPASTTSPLPINAPSAAQGGNPPTLPAVTNISPSTSPGPSSSFSPGAASAAIPSHLTPQKDKRRISFISYNDLLLSVPTTVTSLGEITSGNLSPEHLPGTVSPNLSTIASAGSGFGASVGGAGARSPSLGGADSASQAQSTLAPVSAANLAPASGNEGGSAGVGTKRSASVDQGPLGLGQPIGVGQGMQHKASWDANMTSGAGARSGLGLGDGEWGREGLGKGLEQRLEDLADRQHS